MECTVAITGIDTTEQTERYHATLPHLRRLAVQNPTLLPYLTAPVLDDLLCMYTWSSNSLPLRGFFDESSGITRLTLPQCSVTAELSNLLLHLPALTHFCVGPETYPGDDSDQAVFLDTLTLPDICPRLRTFMYGVGLVFPHDRIFCAMARFRFHLAQFESLRVFNCGCRTEYSREIQNEIQMLRDTGFDAAFWRGNDPALLRAKSDFF